ncbi:hypothetical protein [Exiguobacterium artemiae]
MTRQQQFIRILVLVLLIGGLIWFSRSYLNLSPTDIKDWILSFGMWAPILYIFLYTIRPLIFSRHPSCRLPAVWRLVPGLEHFTPSSERHLVQSSLF